MNAMVFYTSELDILQLLYDYTDHVCLDIHVYIRLIS